MNIYKRPRFEREPEAEGSKTAKFERDEPEETTKPKAVHSIRCTILNILNYITKYGTL
jgi:hypothetical protein